MDLVDDFSYNSREILGFIRCQSKKERHARATALDLHAWRANAGVNATRSIKVESQHPGTLLITRGAHSPRPAVSLPLIATDVLPPLISLRVRVPLLRNCTCDITRPFVASCILILINLWAAGKCVQPHAFAVRCYRQRCHVTSLSNDEAAKWSWSFYDALLSQDHIWR